MLCPRLQDLYVAKGVPFITNEGDTVNAYEEKGKRKQENNTSYDQGMRAFSAMDRINQVEVLTGISFSNLRSCDGRFHIELIAPW